MTYQQTVEFLFNRLPMFEKQGAGAYKPGLETTLALSAMFGNPHNSLKTVHIAGTNGKGSTASTLAAVFQAQGLKVGLYTSPHLIDFRERIRVNGVPVSERFVIDFTRNFLDANNGNLQPTFFELTTIMAFKWFEECGVDIAVIETGLGGRLDSTNIITPLLSIITNISPDHMAQLGDTLEAIAAEKAGIIKPGVPVVISEGGNDSVREVFRSQARKVNAPVYFADRMDIAKAVVNADNSVTFLSKDFGELNYSLKGAFQAGNGVGVLAALHLLKEKMPLAPEKVRFAFVNVELLSGLAARWQSFVCGDCSLIVDCGHNRGAWELNSPELNKISSSGQLAMVFGMVADKDVDAVLKLLPPKAKYYFVAPDSHRALPAAELATKAKGHGIEGNFYSSVAEGLQAALAENQGTIFVGGSCYVAGEALAFIHTL